MTNLAVVGKPRDSRVSNTEEVHLRLREMLLNGEIRPGVVLSQVKLAHELGVSTTPLREAMRLLQAEGLLIAEHNRRSRVAPVDPEDIDAVYASRILVEALAIGLTVPTLTADDDVALKSDQDLAAWEPLHRSFHWRMIKGCDDALARCIEPMIDRSERYRRTSLYGSPARAWAIGNEEHEAIVAACTARRPGEAAVLLARHYARSALTAIAKIAPEQDPVTVRAALQLILQAHKA